VEWVVKRIGIIVKRFPHLSETFILNEILELEAQGVHLHIYSILRPNESLVHEDVAKVQAGITYLSERYARNSSQILYDHVRLFSRHPWRYLKAFVRQLRNCTAHERFAQAVFLAAHLKAQGIQHLHAHYALESAELAQWANDLTGTPFSLACHATDVYTDGRLYSPAFHRYLHQAAFTVVVSTQTKHDLLKTWPDIAPEKVHRIYNGLDLERFRYRESAPSDPLILSVGRAVEKKGFVYLIQACRLLKRRGVPFTCKIIGTGILQESLSRLIFDLDLEDQVRLLGPLPQEELIAHYRQAAIFCLPAIVATNGNRDILPNVLKEAMAIGAPVVTTAIPGIEELVEHGCTGWLVPQQDPWALADALEQLLSDRALASRLAQAGRRVIEERFDRRNNVAQLQSLFESVMHKSRAQTLARSIQPEVREQ